MINVGYKINEHHLGQPRLILESARNDTKHIAMGLVRMKKVQTIHDISLGMNHPELAHS